MVTHKNREKWCKTYFLFHM